MNIDMLQSHLDSVFMLVLVFFTLAATVLAFITVLNVLRLRNVKLTWKAGKMSGYPLFSTLFLGFSMFLLGLAWYQNQTGAYVTLACYNWMGLNWFVASYLMSKRYITDHGIVKNINDPSQTISWANISDFVDREGQHRTTNYLFLYMVDQIPGCSEECAKQCIRIDLTVPRKKHDAFKKILSRKLGRRINCDFANVSSIEQFKRL